MSASKQKRERREARAQGTDKKTLRAQEQAAEQVKKRRGMRNVTIIVLVIVLVFGGMIGVFASPATYRSVEAVEVGGQSLSATEYNYFYCSVRNQYLQQYNSFMSQLGTTLTAADMEAMEYEEGKTWKDVFTEETADMISRVTALTALADAEGIGVDADTQSQLEEANGMIEDAAAEAGVSVDAYLTQMYGKGMTYELWQDLAGRAALADSYAAYKTDSFTYSDSEAIAYYDEHVADYRAYSYRSYLIPVETGEDVDAVEAAAAAKNQADEFVSRLNAGESFADLAIEFADEDSKSYYEDSDLTLYEDTLASSISSAYSDWVTDPARKAGDVAQITDSSTDDIYILSFLGVSSDDNAAKVEKALPDMQANAYESWLAGEMENYPVTEKTLGLYCADRSN